MSERRAWMDEVDLDPATSSLAMGTRNLGDRPWLIVDDRSDVELALKAELCATRHHEVFAARPGTDVAAAAVEELVRRALDLGQSPAAQGSTADDLADLHALDRTGRRTQEDLCLLRRRVDGWHLEAASLCFPSRWRLAEKLGRHITEVHAPVAGYASRLAPRIDAMFDRLGNRPVWRRNWFIHADAALFQPDVPIGGDPVIPASEVRDRLVVRSERQTLRRIDAGHDAGAWILFTIRVQQDTIGEFCEDDRRRRGLARWCTEAAPEIRVRRGVLDAQADALALALVA